MFIKSLSMKRFTQIYLITIGVIATVVFLMFFQYVFNRMSSEHAETLAQSIVKNFEINNYRNITTHNYFELQKNLDKIFSEEQVSYIAFVDKEGREVYVRSKGASYRDLEITSADGVNKSDDLLAIKSTIRLPDSGSIIGYMYLGVNDEMSKNFFNNFRHIYIAFFIGIAVLIIILSRLSAKRLFRSLERIACTFRNTSSLNASPVDESDIAFSEVRTIASEYNEMLRRIRNYEAKIKEDAKLVAMGKTSSSIAHDIRSPLAVIKAYIGMNDIAEDSYGECRAAAWRSVEKLQKMADELVDYARAMKIERSTLLLDRCVESAVTEAIVDCEDRKIKIYKQLQGGLYVNVDQYRIGRVIINLINNSIQAIGNDEGEIIIGTRINDNDMTIWIKDSGCGMCDEHLSRIFEIFYTKGKKSGTGLGLAYCKQVVEAHGGRIEVESRVGKGTTFTIHIPNCVVGSDEATAEIGESEHCRTTSEATAETAS